MNGTRIDARPGTVSTPGGATGLFRLHDGPRGGVYYVGRASARPVPLIVMLHGAGGAGARALQFVQSYADREGLIIVAPDSLGATWDVIEQHAGPDVERLDDALAMVFARYAVDPSRVCIAGFSDGASYALSLGLDNGDLFTHVIAFSPGFMVVSEQVGAPRIYVSHGTRDTVLPVARCSRRLVPQLERAGYDVRYHEFDGGHTVPEEIAAEAIEWLLRARSA